MLSPLNFRGYAATDPMDRPVPWVRFLLMILITGLLSLAFLKLLSRAGQITYLSPNVIIAACLINCLLAVLVTFTRKASSLVPFLIFFLTGLLATLWTAGRDSGGTSGSLWYFPPASLLSFHESAVLETMPLMVLNALIAGLLPLYLTRVLCLAVFGSQTDPSVPTTGQYRSFFNSDCSLETVSRPRRDASFYVLRIIGFIYLGYLAILLTGLPGAEAWPGSAGNLIHMTYENPALAINTYFKISLMIMLAFTGAYNRELRYPACLALLTGHLVSAAYSLIFYLSAGLHASYATFLLESALADGLLGVVFAWIMIRYRKDAVFLADEKDMSISFSVPMTLIRGLYAALGFLFLIAAAAVISIRVAGNGRTGITAVFGYPDPMISNTIVLYCTLSLIAFMLMKRERLRDAFFHTLSIPLIFGGIVSLCWLLAGTAGGGVRIHTRWNTSVQADWYFVAYAIICFFTALLLTRFRQMYFRTDYAINTLSPSAALNVLALTDAFFGGGNQQQVAVLRSVDAYAGGITGRKRGLLNLPFGLFENTLNLLYGLHPPFSTMSREERRYCLRTYFLRNEMERKTSMLPAVAGFAYQIGISLNALVTFAYYSNQNAGHSIGYVPVNARDRTQGDTPAYPPPFRTVAPLPVCPEDHRNFKPVLAGKEGPLIAPRVTTPVMEPDIPLETDYLVIGSGAGGATAAYRLACAVADPARILVVEQGNRYQPLEDFQDNEIAMMKKVYREGGLQQTKQFTMTMMQGECVGGTTVVNNAVCFQMPAAVRQSWQQDYDLNLPGLDEEYDRVAKELDITSLEEGGINQRVKHKFEQAVAAFNGGLVPADRLNTDYPLKVNHLNTMGDGNWNLGNKRMRKRSMLETYIPWSEARGVKVISNLTAVKFCCADKGRADAVILRSGNGHLTRVRVKKAVLVAGGVVNSSQFLMRSAVPNPWLGHALSCNFAFPVTLEFDEEMRAFDGDQITLGALDPYGRSAFENYFNPPASFALSSVPFFFERRDQIMSRYPYLVNFGCLIGSEANGLVQKKADLLNGRPFTWRLGNQDISHIKYGLGTLVELGRLAGARRAVLPTRPGIDLDLLRKQQLEQFRKDFEAFPLRMRDLYMGTAHPQGGNLMAGDNSRFRNRRVVNSNFQVEGFENVFVTDASVFPTSITVNPQWTIMALSSLAVKKMITLIP